MPQTVFYPSLNEFCRKYFIADTNLTVADQLNFPAQIKAQQDALFEQFMLFDRLSFKVYGENICAAVLMRSFGERGFEALLEQAAIGFDLWTPMIGHSVQDIPGLNPLVYGNVNSPAHCDPEQSAELGLGFLDKKLPRWKRRPLVRKMVKAYNVPEEKLVGSVVSTVTSAFNAGRLLPYGFDPKQQDFQNLNLAEREKLTQCAQDLLEYRYLISNNMTSFPEYKYYSPFWNTADKFKNAETIQVGFREIAAIEGFPNTAALTSVIKDPFTQLDTSKYRSGGGFWRRAAEVLAFG